MKIDPKELYSISFYEYGEAYFGSCGGTRYRLAREPLKNVHYTPVDQRDPAVLLATVWPEPYAYGALPRRRNGLTEGSLRKKSEYEDNTHISQRFCDRT